MQTGAPVAKATRASTDAKRELLTNIGNSLREWRWMYTKSYALPRPIIGLMEEDDNGHDLGPDTSGSDASAVAVPTSAHHDARSEQTAARNHPPNKTRRVYSFSEPAFQQAWGLFSALSYQELSLFPNSRAFTQSTG